MPVAPATAANDAPAGSEARPAPRSARRRPDLAGAGALAFALLALLASSLGAFSGTRRIDAAASALQHALNESRLHAIGHKTRALPVLLRNRSGEGVMVYAVRALRMDGALPEPGAKFAEGPRWKVLDAEARAQLNAGAFVYLVPDAPLDLNQEGTETAPAPGCEMIQLRARADGHGFAVVARGLHNTAPCPPGGATGYMVVSSREAGSAIAPEEARDFELHGFSLGQDIVFDVAPASPRAEAFAPPPPDLLPLRAPLTAQAALFYERSASRNEARTFPAPESRPVFAPIFDETGAARHAVPGPEAARASDAGETPSADQTLRLRDLRTLEVRYLTVHGTNGRVEVSREEPAGP
ncbi:MAG: hypothetical protein L6R28_06885 [Planctomycetes bacterium]|nr:hypothetical protein [Planctomycetota bacterium]